MRSTILALALAAIAAAPAAAQQAGQPSGAPFPFNVDNANGPSMGDPAALFGSVPEFRLTSAMARLHAICQKRTLRERLTCQQAWREINAAYATLHPDRVATPARD